MRGSPATIDVANTNTYGGCFGPRFSRISARNSARCQPPHVGAGARHQHRRELPGLRRRRWTAGSCASSASTTSRGAATSCTPDGMHFEWVGEPRNTCQYPSKYCPNVPGGGSGIVPAHGECDAQRDVRRRRLGACGGLSAASLRPGGDSIRDHRRRAGGQHGGDVCGPARRRGDAHRARRRRRRRAPVGLHPVEDDDRHRRRDELHPADSTGWASSSSSAEVDVEALTERIESIKDHLQQRHDAVAREPGRRDGARLGARWSARTRSRSRPTDGTAHDAAGRRRAGRHRRRGRASPTGACPTASGS